MRGDASVGTKLKKGKRKRGETREKGSEKREGKRKGFGIALGNSKPTMAPLPLLYMNLTRRNEKRER
jgi:hypothetical protein